MANESRQWRTPNELVKMKKRKLDRNTMQASLVSTSVSAAKKRQVCNDEQPITSEAKVMRLKTVSERDLSTLPIDMSIKNKVRIVSNSSFSWLLSAKANQEIAGLVAFSNAQSLSEEESVSSFYHSLMYWTHPSMTSLRVISNETPPTALDAKFIDALKDNWICSFQSVFQLLKAGYCPYFYLCGGMFSVLFQKTQALISPTTSGFREALNREGIDYALPLSETLCAGSTASDDDDESSATNWLQSIGFPTHQRSITTMMPLQHKPYIDFQPESTVCIAEEHFVGLCNFLINCKTLIPTTGQYNGIPPTILSPISFEGGTLSKLKVKQSNQQQLVDRKMMHSFSLELNGPVLPQMVTNLCQVLVKTQEGNFDIHFNSIKTSTSFNIHPNFTIQCISCSNHSFTWK